MLPYISPLFPFLPANALKRHSLFGLHSKYECVYFSFAFTHKNYSHTKYNRSSPCFGMSLTPT
ncbi:hypothetical protein K427_09265 [Escherichia coli MP1]|nr:hypothetical protein HMPREF9553_02221 [Escherichia coli MS 200-1]EGB82493.1 hypothetical protein HMPREF9533_02695 [Escherichia coli MS 60-1]ESE24457.1 hypothetical protein HMPREF1623_01821 [Escherichia coli 910096-2]ESE35671.1 hypothetical protein HMPREF1622_01889 [Escherichia coli A35218R]EWY53866.1 hypothetical protein K427_09265 [Escherichia coli MP1]KDT42086.1 hypothetical protein AD15_4220 [Escherichia coli 3-105-05_S4_C2]OSK79546.1 hypothetical protein EAAG_03359 [Escherichia coli H0